MLAVKDTIDAVLKTKGMKRRELANALNITEQNLSNKLQRDSISAKELVEIGIKTGMKLVYIDEDDNSAEYEIVYDADELFKPKRKPDSKTDAERQEISKRSAATRMKNKLEKEEA